MTSDKSIELSSLRFEGRRFEGHALDVQCTQELIAYRWLVLECAKELWRRKYPDRLRLPKGFEDGFRLQFDRINPGSAIVPLMRVREVPQGELDLGDEFDEAAALIDATISAANKDERLPEQLPASVIPGFRALGSTLRPDEILFTKARNRDQEAPYTVNARTRLAQWVGDTYEDIVDLEGEVQMANLKPGIFTLQIEESDIPVNGRFNAHQEELVLEALRNHRIVRLRVSGIAEFSTADRQIRRMLRTDHVALAPTAPATFDKTAVPIWEQLSNIGREAPAGTWESVPDDLSMRIDDIVYGQGNHGR
jgi:hypothetical protein